MVSSVNQPCWVSLIGLENQAPGEWSSSDESVISVDSQSGKAVAVGKGTAAGIHFS